jgi:hypothetical protein
MSEVALKVPPELPASMKKFIETVKRFAELLRASAVPTAPSNVGFRGQTGKHLLVLSFTGFDPSRSSRARFAVMHNAAFLQRCGRV